MREKPFFYGFLSALPVGFRDRRLYIFPVLLSSTQQTARLDNGVLACEKLIAWRKPPPALFSISNKTLGSGLQLVMKILDMIFKRFYTNLQRILYYGHLVRFFSFNEIILDSECLATPINPILNLDYLVFTLVSYAISLLVLH